MSTQQPIRIVLLGGGYVSVFAYKQLVRQLRKEIRSGAVKIDVVCPLQHHIYHGWTSENLTGTLRLPAQESPLEEVMPLAQIRQGYAERIDLREHTVWVRLQGGEVLRLGYDHLVIGTGSVDNDTLEGARTYGYQVKCREAFERARRHLREKIAQAARQTPEEARQTLRFAVAGGGLTGVELIANLAEYVHMMKRQLPALRDVSPSFYLIHGGERILPDLQGKFDTLVRYAERTLRQYGVHIIPNKRIQQITPQGAVLSDGSLLESSMVITTVGQRRIAIGGTEGLKRDEEGRILLDRQLRVEGYDEVWGGGDACSAQHPVFGTPCLSNALWAIKQGEHIGKNLARVVRGKKPRSFRYPGLGQAASLGLGKGIAEIYRVPFTGTIAWLMRWFFFHYFLWRISPRSAQESLKDWFYLFRTGKRVEQANTLFLAQTLDEAGEPVGAEAFAANG